MTAPRRELLFPSPLYLSRPPGTEALRADLRDTLLAEARGTPGVRQSNVGGWHSSPDLLERGRAPFPALASLLVDGLRVALAAECAARGKTLDPTLRIGGFGWAMVMGRGHYSLPHHHGDAHWACAWGAPTPSTCFPVGRTCAPSTGCSCVSRVGSCTTSTRIKSPVPGSASAPTSCWGSALTSA